MFHTPVGRVARALEQQSDPILLHLMMLRLEGFALCAALRRLGRPGPILILTAKGQIEHPVPGLDAGADDYLVKPFSTEELLARVRALLRRVEPPARRIRTLNLGEVTVAFVAPQAWRGKQPLHLTPKAFAPLRLLAESTGQVVSRDRFLDVIWAVTAFPTPRTVDNHIAMRRAKIKPHPEHPRWTKTVPGAGYRLAAPEALSPRAGAGLAGALRVGSGRLPVWR